MEAKTPSPGISSEEITYWMKDNYKPILTGIFAMGLMGLVYVYTTSKSEAAEHEAAQELFALQVKGETTPGSVTAAELEALAVKSRDTGISQHAAIRAAARIFASGNYQEAQQAYESFLREYSSSPLIPEAYLGIAVSLEALKQTDAALARFQELTTRFPDSGAGVRAKVSQARLLKEKGESAQAFQIYRELTSLSGFNAYGQRASWEIEAQIAMSDLLKAHPELIQTNSPAVPAIPAALPEPVPAPASAGN